jgi:acetyl-CoA acetyltransferase
VTFPQIDIVGVYRTQQARVLERSAQSLCLEAALGALADAGLTLDDVDGISARWTGPGGTMMHPGSQDWASFLRRPCQWVGDNYQAGVPFLLDAAGAIATGQCHTVLMMGGQSGVNSAATASYTRPENEFTGVYGSFTAGQFALVAREYYERFGSPAKEVAGLAAMIRNQGAIHPDAVMRGRGPYTADDVLASPMIAEPLHLLELCLANDGAVAVVVTTAERARDCRATPIRMLGGGMEWHRQQYVDWPVYHEVGRVGALAAATAFGQAGISAADLDVLELYDANAFEVLRQLEVLGYCGEGEGAAFVADGGIGDGGRGPAINTDGGLMAYGHCGLAAPSLKIVEAVEQLRGTARGYQVPDARLAGISGAGSGAQYHNVAVLGRE